MLVTKYPFDQKLLFKFESEMTWTVHVVEPTEKDLTNRFGRDCMSVRDLDLENNQNDYFFVKVLEIDTSKVLGNREPEADDDESWWNSPEICELGGPSILGSHQLIWIMDKVAMVEAGDFQSQVEIEEVR